LKRTACISSTVHRCGPMNTTEIHFEVADSIFTYTKIDSSLRLKCRVGQENGGTVLPMCWYGDFHNGVASVLDGVLDGFGYINSRGLFITPMQYIAAGDFSEDRAFVTDDTSTKLIDTSGTVLADFKTILITGKFSEGIALVSKVQNDTAGEFKRDAYVDLTGRFVVDFGAPDEISSAGIISDDDACSDGLIRVHTSAAATRRFGFMDLNQRLRIPYMYEDASRFCCGLAAASKRGRYGYIDDRNRAVIDFRFDAARAFSDELAPVRIGGLWGYIDLRGKEVIAPTFDEADAFRGGSARVKVGEKYGIIDTTGEFLAPPRFDGMTNFHHGICRIVLGARKGVMNRAGDMLMDE